MATVGHRWLLDTLELLGVLEGYADCGDAVLESHAREARELRSTVRPLQRVKMYTLPEPTRKEKKASDKARIREESRDLRARAWLRAEGCCEAYLGVNVRCGMAYDLQLDHWLGGSGRRIPEQRLETVWLLCQSCHKARTSPITPAGVAWWNDLFRWHCARHGYPFTPHILKDPLR